MKPMIWTLSSVKIVLWQFCTLLPMTGPFTFYVKPAHFQSALWKASNVSAPPDRYCTFWAMTTMTDNGRRLWSDYDYGRSLSLHVVHSDMEAMPVMALLRWVGHMQRISDNRIPKQNFYLELSSGARSRGAQRSSTKTWHEPCRE